MYDQLLRKYNLIPVKSLIGYTSNLTSNDFHKYSVDI